MDYGTAASSLFPKFFDKPTEMLWNSTNEPCDAPQLKDYTGVDSLAAFLVSIFSFVVVQMIETCNEGKPLFHFAGLNPYGKQVGKDNILDTTKGTLLDNSNNTVEYIGNNDTVPADATQLSA